MDKISRIKDLIQTLNKARNDYYNNDISKITDKEYDQLYDELLSLENETGFLLSNSPTNKVGASVDSSKLAKEEHIKKMLSLDKTKNVEDLKSFLGDKVGVLSLKLDGLTVVLTYKNGELIKALTRGDGTTGEIVTTNAKQFLNLPLKIDYQDDLTVRGEAIITYSDFDTLKEIEGNEEFKNPRNLASGSVRLLNNEENKQKNINTKNRKVSFYAFSVVSTSKKNNVSIKQNNEFLKELGFDITPYKQVDKNNIQDKVNEFTKELDTFDLPADGLVLTYDDIAFGESLGETARFPRNAIAFKWEDELKETVLRKIEWRTSRTGLINPIAIFDPVLIDGTSVARASLHNLSIIKDLNLHIGDTINVYKANMIIPQVLENLTGDKYSGEETLRDGVTIPIEFTGEFIPKKCLICEADTIIKNLNGTLELFCTNENCPARNLEKWVHFVSKKCFNIEGLSESTLNFFIERDYLNSFPDIFKLEKNHRKEIEEKIKYKKLLTKFISKYNLDETKKENSKTQNIEKIDEKKIDSYITIKSSENEINLLSVLKENDSLLFKTLSEIFENFKNNALNNPAIFETEKINFFKESKNILETEKKDTFEGFDDLSIENLFREINNKRNIKLSKFITSLGIKGVGETVAELISSFYDESLEKVLKASEEDLKNIDMVGEIIAKDFTDFMSHGENIKIIEELKKEITIESENTKDKTLSQYTFVITGSLENFGSRDELKDLLKNKGAKISSSVSSNTSFLINNDLNSNSTKNKKAKELGVKIINENELMKLIS